MRVSPLVRLRLLPAVMAFGLQLGVAPLFGGEVVRFRNGAQIEVDRHEQQGSDVFLYAKGNIRIVELAEIERIDVPGQAVPAGTAAAASSGGRIGGARSGGGGARPGDASIHRLIDQAADRHGVPASLVHAVAEVESRYNPDVRSGSGAIGVMQLMPSTARHFGADPWDPAQNIEAGTRFLRELLRRYEGMPNQTALALAAYNAGPGAVDYWGGVPPYEETIRYVEKTMRAYRANDDR